MNYEMPKPPHGYKTDLALIIAPYFDLWFGSHIIKQLSPRRIRFVVDDGSRAEDVDRLLRKCGASGFDIKVVLGGAPGIVHLKGYYLEFTRLNGKGRPKRKFFFGSANATKAAFGGVTNAELVAEVDLSVEENQEILQYLGSILSAVESGGGAVNATTMQATRNVPKLFLPSFRITKNGPAPGFDAWLQRGKLAAKHRETQQFMTVAVQLKRSLPAGQTARLFANQGLILQGKRNVVRHRYMGKSVTEIGDAAVRRWKAKYCVWTHLGDWLSEECYDSRHHLMVSGSKRARETAIMELIENGQNTTWRVEKSRRFLDKITAVWRALQSANLAPSDYFKVHGGQINKSYYEERFHKKLSADFVQANDKKFHERYINGYEFPDVPKFRQDAIAWREFIRSWCESVAVEAAKNKSQSLIVKAIRATLAPADPTDLDPEEISAELRARWNGDLVGHRVAAKYTDGEFYLGKIARVATKAGKKSFTIEYDDGGASEVGHDGIQTVGALVSSYFEDDRPYA